jgi:sugar/nucleoside kinase (ribokinase family)
MNIPEGDLDLLAIGEVVVDFISTEETDWLRNAYTFRKYLGGSPANIATTVGKLGGQAAIVTKTGIGAMGQFLKSELNRASVITDYLIMDHRVHTSIVFISRTAKTADFEAFRGGDYQLTPEEIRESCLQRAKVVHASTWPLSREPSRSAVEHAFKVAADAGKVISLDPNYSPQIWPDYRDARATLEQMLAYATIAKPSRDDAMRIFGRDRTPEEYIRRFHDMGPEVVIFTMGSEGVIISEDGHMEHIPSREIKVVDATGAGDAFWAGFLVAILDGHPLKQSVLFAREIVERKLSQVGPLPDMINREEIYALLEA